MKKFLIFTFVCFCILAQKTNAIEVNLTKDGGVQNLVSKVGFKILNANKIDKRMVFLVSEKNHINAVTYYHDRSIYVYKGLILYIDDEDQLAAVLGHEISHGIDYYDGIFRGFFSFIPQSFASKKYETKADKRAVDFLVNAGYNPVALIVVMNKCFGQSRYDWIASHPLTSRRMITIYEYIYNKYPEYLVNNSYKENIYYQNFLLNSRDNREKLRLKLKNGSKAKYY